MILKCFGAPFFTTRFEDKSYRFRLPIIPFWKVDTLRMSKIHIRLTQERWAHNPKFGSSAHHLTSRKFKCIISIMQYETTAIWIQTQLPASNSLIRTVYYKCFWSASKYLPESIWPKFEKRCSVQFEFWLRNLYTWQSSNTSGR